MDRGSLPSAWVQKKDERRHGTPLEKGIVVRQLHLKSVDLQFTPSSLNVIWSLSCVCLSFTVC